LKGLEEEFEESRGLSDWFLVGSILIFSLQDLQFSRLNTFLEIGFEALNKPACVVAKLLELLNFFSIASFLTLSDDVDEIGFFDWEVTHFL
jgi:hypothetical protein